MTIIAGPVGHRYPLAADDRAPLHAATAAAAAAAAEPPPRHSYSIRRRSFLQTVQFDAISDFCGRQPISDVDLEDSGSA